MGRRSAVLLVGAATTRLYDEDADLYDLAFDWDLTDEAAWIHGRLGPDCRWVLEPGCGSGRVLVALGRRDLDVVGLDQSRRMVELARRRLEAERIRGEVLLADMTDFELGRVFDGAVCPIDTLAHLEPTEAARHLERMGAHLREGARYLVQLAVYSAASVARDIPGSHWKTEGEPRLRIDWTTESVDLAAARTVQRSRIEVLSGPRTGEVVEELHRMTAWTPGAWADAVAVSPFTLAAVFDGSEEPPASTREDATGGLIWFELVR